MRVIFETDIVRDFLCITGTNILNEVSGQAGQQLVSGLPNVHSTPLLQIEAKARNGAGHQEKSAEALTASRLANASATAAAMMRKKVVSNIYGSTYDEEEEEENENDTGSSDMVRSGYVIRPAAGNGYANSTSTAEVDIKILLPDRSMCALRVKANTSADDVYAVSDPAQLTSETDR